MHMKKAVIFDLDGTLANTLTSLAYCTNRALEDLDCRRSHRNVIKNS